jgi:hypothetical protein
MKHYVYGLYTKNTGRPRLFYIGISSGFKNLYHRENNHRTESCNPHKLAIIRKYDFSLQVIWTVDTREEAEEREEFLIRWFGDTITNICKHSKDLSYARSKPKKPKNQWKKHSLKAKLANRDRNLTIPYEEVISLIEEWAQNPFETQQSFADRKKILRSRFKDWLRLYKPEYIGLQKKKLEEIARQIKQNKEQKSVKHIITSIMELTGFNHGRAKSFYYRKIKS